MATYTIRLEDEASPAAARVRTAMVEVARAAERVAVAVRTEDRAYQAVSRTAAKFAGTELRAARAIMAVEKSARKVAPPLEKTNGLFSTLKTGGLAVAAVIGGALVRSTIEFGRGLLEAAGRAQQFDSALDAIGKGKVNEQLSENWTKELIRLKVPLEQGREDVIALLAAFKSVEGVNAGVATNDILKLGAALQLSEGQAKSFNKVFKDIGGKGKIQREELVGQLGDVGIGVTSTDFLKEVAAMKKVDFATAEKMLGKGQITADIAIPALIAATKKARGLDDLDAAANKASGGINAALTNVDNSWTVLKEKLGQSLVDKGALEQVNKLADALFKLADNADRIVAVAGKLADALKILNGDTSVKASALLGAEEGGTAAKILDITPNQIVDQIGSFWGDMFTSGQNLGDAVNQGMATGLNQSLAPVEAVTQLSSDLVSSSQAELGIHSPSKVFADIGAYTDEGLAMGIDDNADLVLESAQALADGAISEAEMATTLGPGVNQTAVANVGAAAGNALGGSGGSGGASAGANVTVAITIDGAQGPDATAEAIRAFFETDFATLLERQLEGSGAD